MARLCGNCRKPGHRIETCKDSKVENPNVLPPPATVQGNVQEAEVTIVRQALPEPKAAEPSKVPEAATWASEVLAPRKGLWVVSVSRKRIAGKILQVKDGGAVLYENMFGAHMESPPEKIRDSGYQFVDLTPQMLLWIGKDSH